MSDQESAEDEEPDYSVVTIRQFITEMVDDDSHRGECPDAMQCGYLGSKKVILQPYLGGGWTCRYSRRGSGEKGHQGHSSCCGVIRGSTPLRIATDLP